MKQFVNTLKEKDHVKSVFLIKDKKLLKDKKGNSYLSATALDKTGSVNVRVWESVDRNNEQFEEGDFVLVKGYVQLYQNRKQIIANEVVRVSSDDCEIEDFFKSSTESPNKMFEQLMSEVESLENVFIKQLCLKVLESPENEVKLKKGAAARTIHHAYVGGLLEHILSICKLMNFIANHYSFLNRDYLIFGAIFHDLGKIKELEIKNGINYTDTGRLVGHMMIACEMIDQYSAKIDEFPSSLKDQLKHIVLSHHGKLEYGSPKRPKFLEALVVAMIDELDSRINSVFDFMKSEIEVGENWSRYNSMYDRYFYLDILKEQLDKEL